MNFDIRTLSIITALSSLVFAFAAFTVGLLVPRQRYLRDWSWGAGMGALSTMLVGLRGVLPDLVSAAMANTALVVAFTLMYTGARGMVGLPPARAAVWLFAVCAFLGLAWFTVVDVRMSARILIISLTLVPLMVLTAMAFWRHDQAQGPGPLRLANRITVLVFALGVVLFIVRLYPVMQSASPSTYLSSTSVLLVSPYFWAILFNVWMSIMITLTVSARLQAELADARDQAQANSVAKGQFLANMSHEIRTPMNAVLGMLTLLQSTELTPRQRDYADKTERAARSLLGLLNDILDFSKVEAGKMSLDPQPVRLQTVMRDLAVILEANVGSKPIDLACDLDPEIPPVLLVDGLRLQQVLLNLGGNAVKFTPQGRVVVAARLRTVQNQAAQVEFLVQDTGIGIAPENRERIFSGFSQAEASTTRRFGGTGLGLAISQRLVQLMGGDLALESELGQGSCFRFELWLPVVGEEVQQAVPEAPPAPAPGGGDGGRVDGMRLLVVEDNPVNQQVVLELLQSRGARVTLAANGQLGVDAVAAAEVPFDAVLMDVQMPVLDGYGATRLIREHLGQRELPIIAMTANALASDREACLAAGMNDHVGKPFELTHLVDVLRHLVPRFAHHPTQAVTAPERASVAARGQVPMLLDVDGALHRMGGMRPLYVRAARLACAELTVWMASAPPDAGEAAVRQMHTLKGSSAVLGAGRLSALAARLEKDYRDGVPREQLAQGWQELQSAMAATREALEGAIASLGLAGAQAGANVPGPAADAPDLRVVLHDLMQALLASDLQALQHFTALQPALEAQAVPELGELEAAVHSLQFEEAHAVCLRMVERHAARTESAA